MTRATALRMIHAGAVAASPAELEAWIGRTDDLRERLANGGHGTAFTAHDLFESFVARATAATPARSGATPARRLWIGAIVIVLAIVLAILVAVFVTNRVAL